MDALGFYVDVQMKKKDPPILSAFVKANTLKLLLTIEEDSKGIHREEKVTIKLEIDTNPPPEFEVESKLVLTPLPFYVLSYHPKDLFAGKMHAILCRSWKTRVKGRDWYDLIWFIQNRIPVHLLHLEKRMQQSGHLSPKKKLDHRHLLELLEEKISQIDWNQAKNDVKPFLPDVEGVDVWSRKFFSDLITNLIVFL